MNCDKCSTRDEILLAVRGCYICDHQHKGCADDCPTFVELRKRCLSCNPESDAGTPHHRVRVIENAIGGNFAIEPDYLYGRHPDRSIPLTPLSPEAEAAALKVVLAFADLELWELAIVHCLLNHIRGDYAAEMLGLNSRAAYHARLKRVLAAHPWAASLHLGHRLGIKTTVSR